MAVVNDFGQFSFLYAFVDVDIVNLRYFIEN